MVELLVIFSIIGILATIAVVTYRGGQASARDQQRIVAFSQFRAALEDYYDEYGFYPCGDSPSAWEDPAGSENYYTVNSSGSSGFLNGGGGTDCIYSPPGSGDVWPYSFPATPDDEDGLFDANYINDSWPKDPINDSTYRYWYAAPVSGRTEYYLWVRLEDNNEQMTNDGGVCDDFYEVFSNGWYPDHVGFTPTGC